MRSTYILIDFKFCHWSGDTALVCNPYRSREDPQRNTVTLPIVYHYGNTLVNTYWEVYHINMMNEESKYQFIGKKIREAREGAGFSQKQLAEKLGYESATAVSYIEAGERKVSVVDLEQIAQFLDKDIKYFIGKETEPLNVRVALRAEGFNKDDQEAILHIVEMAKKRAKGNGGAN